MSVPVQVWIQHGQLLTNRPDVFAKNFDLPETAPVDGITRVSHRLGKPKPAVIPADDRWTDAIEDWLSEGEGG